MMRDLAGICLPFWLGLAGCESAPMNARGTGEAKPSARSERAKMLEFTADAAANNGTVAVVKRSIEDLGKDSRHDPVAEHCSAVFLSKGDNKSAREVAGMIHDKDLRQATLTKLGE